MEILWWHWMVLGLGLAMAELALNSFFIIWFGLAALLVGLVVLVMPALSVSAQIFLWTLMSVAMTALWFKVFRKEQKPSAEQEAAALGEIGVLVRAIEVGKSGEARFQKPIMGADVWPCVADAAIALDARVKVIAVDGQQLKVVKS